jgi:serine/threonine protein kinase
MEKHLALSEGRTAPSLAPKDAHSPSNSGDLQITDGKNEEDEGLMVGAEESDGEAWWRRKPAEADDASIPGEAGDLGGEVRLADFGNGVDARSVVRMYGPDGPLKSDSTLDYAPPEVLFGTQAFAPGLPESYDMWSVGVVMLEVFFGTPDVFKVSSRTRAKVEAQMGPKVGGDVKNKAVLFRAFWEYCIYEPTPQGKDVWLPKACDDVKFAAVLRKWDPLGRGSPDKLLTKLMRRLLHWDPAQRLSADRALTHAYFKGPYRCVLNPLYSMCVRGVR